MVDTEITRHLPHRPARLEHQSHRPLLQLQRILPRGSHRRSISFPQDDAWFGSLQKTQGPSTPRDGNELVAGRRITSRALEQRQPCLRGGRSCAREQTFGLRERRVVTHGGEEVVRLGKRQLGVGLAVGEQAAAVAK